MWDPGGWGQGSPGHGGGPRPAGPGSGPSTPAAPPAAAACRPPSAATPPPPPQCAAGGPWRRGLAPRRCRRRGCPASWHRGCGPGPPPAERAARGCGRWPSLGLQRRFPEDPQRTGITCDPLMGGAPGPPWTPPEEGGGSRAAAGRPPRGPTPQVSSGKSKRGTGVGAGSGPSVRRTFSDWGLCGPFGLLATSLLKPHLNEQKKKARAGGPCGAGSQAPGAQGGGGSRGLGLPGPRGAALRTAIRAYSQSFWCAPADTVEQSTSGRRFCGDQKSGFQS